jgi:hypothetical protein
MEHMMIVQRVLIAPLLLLALTSCIVSSHQPTYPEKWEPQEAAGSTDNCPALAGLYAERGDAPNGCLSGMEACRSLSYNLLHGNIGYKEVWDQSTEPRFPIGTHVELRQPSDDTLEIIQWQLGNNQERVVGKKTLKMEKGDFTCSDDGLSLQPRLVYFLWGLSNLLGTVSMNFKTNEDGCLVLKSKFSYIGHHVIFPGAHSFGAWVRWRAANWSEAVNTTTRQPISPRYAEIAGLPQHEQLLVKAEQGDAEAQLQLYGSSKEPKRLAWLCRSADHGLAEASYRIGRLYQHGQEGLPRDNARAYLWYRLASIDGHAQAKIELEDMQLDMSPEQREEGERLFSEWKPGQCELENVPDDPGK